MNRIKTIPLELRQANEFVDNFHRHHDSVHRDKFRFGAVVDGKLVGVCQVARPVSRHLDDGNTLEVVRLCTNGSKDVCSFCYSKAARIAKELGYSKIITYILNSESGASLKASGWQIEAETKGGSWDRPSRRRTTTAPIVPKVRYSRILRKE